MIFTQEQINEIKQRLALAGTKDSALPFADLPLSGDEILAIVQEGSNKKVSLQEFFEGFSQYIDGSERVDLFNVSRYAQRLAHTEQSVALTLDEAVALCTGDIVRGGQIITFVDYEGNWSLWQYTGVDATEWNNTDEYWLNIEADPSLGIIFTTSDSTLPMGESKEVALHFETVDKGIAGVVKLFVDDELYKTYNKVSSFDISYEVTEETKFTIEVHQYGYTYKEDKRVYVTLPAWIGAGTEYSQVIKEDNKIEVTDSINGNYQVTFTDLAKLILVTPSSIVLGTVSMSGFSVPLAPTQTITVNDMEYKVYTSANSYIAGTHAFEIGNYKGDDKAIIEEMQQSIGGMQVLLGEQENTNQEQTKNINDLQQGVQALQNEGLNGPDNEDITLVNRQYKLANKLYDPLNFSGQGRVYVRKNIQDIVEVDGNVTTTTRKNVLTQGMMSLTHTMYIIQYDFDLNGGTIELPEGCTIKFEGGSITDSKTTGCINLNNTKVLPSYDDLNALGNKVIGTPAIGTQRYLNGKPWWFDGTQWKDAVGTTL